MRPWESVSAAGRVGPPGGQAAATGGPGNGWTERSTAVRHNVVKGILARSPLVPVPRVEDSLERAAHVRSTFNFATRFNLLY